MTLSDEQIKQLSSYIQASDISSYIKAHKKEYEEFLKRKDEQNGKN